MIRGASRELQVIVDSYNESQHILTLALSLLSAVVDYDNLSDLTDTATSLSRLITHNMLAEAYELDMIAQGDVLYYSSGQEVEIQSDYILESIGYSGSDNIIPAGLVTLPIDLPLVSEIMVVERVVLHYRPRLLMLYPKTLPFPLVPLRFDLPASYPPDYGGITAMPSGEPADSIGIWREDTNTLPEIHNRYTLTMFGLMFLACQSDHTHPVMQEDIYPAFSWSDGQWCSKGINGSWYDSYLWIKDRIGGYPLHLRIMSWATAWGYSATLVDVLQPPYRLVNINGWRLPTETVGVSGGKPPAGVIPLIPITTGGGIPSPLAAVMPHAWINYN